MTDYLILKQIEGEGGVWEQHATARSSSPQRALRNSNLEAGTYVAVPVRSFRLLTVKIEQTTKVTIG